MEQTTLNVTEPATWLARGRSPAEAAALAKAWCDFPDLPATASSESRMARTRERTIAMRPIFEAMQERTEAERQANNFAFMQRKIERGEANEQDKAIVRGRDEHGYDWDLPSNTRKGGTRPWQDGSIAARFRHQARLQSGCEPAYDHGFTQGGGDTSDVFDAARRANIAASAESASASPEAPITSGKLKPSLWPMPQDGSGPVSWQRRAVILSEVDLQPLPGRDGRVPRRPPAIDLIRERSSGQATIIVISATCGFIAGDACLPAKTPMTSAEADRLIADATQREVLRALLADREIDDLLVTAQDEYLRVLDALGDAIPVLRTMERTRNTPLQQRGHLDTWLGRGRQAGQNIGAGHIRWSKAAKGLTAKLGEFTARYAGPAPDRGHLIRVCLDDGTRAEGFVTADHAPLSPDIRISSKAKLRQEMAQALRSFGGATRLSPRLQF